MGVAGFAGGAGVEEGVGEAGEGVEEPVAGVLEDVVGPGEVEVGAEDDIGVHMQLVADPAHADPIDAVDPVDVVELVLDAIDEDGIRVVHEPPVDVAGGVAVTLSPPRLMPKVRRPSLVAVAESISSAWSWLWGETRWRIAPTTPPRWSCPW